MNGGFLHPTPEPRIGEQATEAFLHGRPRISQETGDAIGHRVDMARDRTHYGGGPAAGRFRDGENPAFERRGGRQRPRPLVQIEQGFVVDPPGEGQPALRVVITDAGFQKGRSVPSPAMTASRSGNRFFSRTSTSIRRSNRL